VLAVRGCWEGKPWKSRLTWLTLSPTSSHTSCNRAPRRLLVHRAHVVRSLHQVAATTIAPLQHYHYCRATDSHSLLRRARLSPARLRSFPLLYISSRADHIAYCNTRYFAYRTSATRHLSPFPGRARDHNRDRFCCSPIVLSAYSWTPSTTFL